MVDRQHTWLEERGRQTNEGQRVPAVDPAQLAMAAGGRGLDEGGMELRALFGRDVVVIGRRHLYARPERRAVPAREQRGERDACEDGDDGALGLGSRVRLLSHQGVKVELPANRARRHDAGTVGTETDHTSDGKPADEGGARRHRAAPREARHAERQRAGRVQLRGPHGHGRARERAEQRGPLQDDRERLQHVVRHVVDVVLWLARWAPSAIVRRQEKDGRNAVGQERVREAEQALRVGARARRRCVHVDAARGWMRAARRRSHEEEAREPALGWQLRRQRRLEGALVKQHARRRLLVRWLQAPANIHRQGQIPLQPIRLPRVHGLVACAEVAWKLAVAAPEPALRRRLNPLADIVVDDVDGTGARRPQASAAHGRHACRSSLIRRR
eukprot:3848676-Prymnesium_polylepis.1